MADAVGVILGQPHAFEIAACSEIDIARWCSGHKLGDGKLMCMDAMVEERRLFSIRPAGNDRPPQGGGVSFETRAHPQHDQIALLDDSVAGPSDDRVDARAGADHRIVAITVSAERLAYCVACSGYLELAHARRHLIQHGPHSLCRDAAGIAEHVEFRRALAIARLRHDMAYVAQPDLRAATRFLSQGDDLLRKHVGGGQQTDLGGHLTKELAQDFFKRMKT